MTPDVRLSGDVRSKLMVIVDKSAFSRACMVAFLAREFSEFMIEDAGCVETLKERRCLEHAELAIVAADAKCPIDPLETIRALAEASPRVPIITVAQGHDKSLLRALTGITNVRAVVHNSVPPRTVLAMIGIVLEGGSSFLHSVSDGNEDCFADCPRALDAKQSDLTPRERDVMKILGQGSSNKLIAKELGLSDNTVKVHIRQIIRKLAVTNRTQAAILARAKPESFGGSCGVDACETVTETSYQNQTLRDCAMSKEARSRSIRSTPSTNR